MAASKELRRLRRLAKQERLLRDREAIRSLREHYAGYGAKEGYSLDLKKIAAMPAGKRRALRKKHQRTAQLLATPHVILKPKTAGEAKVLRRETRQRFKGQKHYIVHVPDPKRSSAAVVEGKLQISTKFTGKGGGVFEERFFRLPHRPKSPDDILAMFDAMAATMPKSGEFILQTDTYGDTGESALDLPAVRRQLQTYLASYDKEKYGAHRFMNRITGWRWTRSKLRGKIIRQERSKAREAEREAYLQRRDEYRKAARKMTRGKA